MEWNDTLACEECTGNVDDLVRMLRNLQHMEKGEGSTIADRREEPSFQKYDALRRLFQAGVRHLRSHPSQYMLYARRVGIPPDWARQDIAR